MSVHIGTHRAVVTQPSLLQRLGQLARQFRRLILLAFLRRLLDGVVRSLGVLAVRTHVRRTCNNRQLATVTVATGRIAAV